MTRLDLEELRKIVGGRYWGPGRFRAALRAAVDEGLVGRRSRTVYAPGTEPDRTPRDQDGDGGAHAGAEGSGVKRGSPAPQ